MQSKFLVFMLGIIIATSFCICFYEGKDLKSEYDQSMKIWEEHLVHKADAAKRSGEEVSANSQATKNGGQETALSIEEIVRRILILESSNGVNNFSKCEAIGKFNRSGYGIHSGKYLCFDTKEEEEKTIGEWFKKRLKTMSLEEALVKYCPENPNYINNFKSL